MAHKTERTAPSPIFIEPTFEEGAGAPHESKDCLHCGINELLALSQRGAEEELAALIQAIGERLAGLVFDRGADAHELLGQTVGTLSHAIHHYMFINLHRMSRRD